MMIALIHSSWLIHPYQLLCISWRDGPGAGELSKFPGIPDFDAIFLPETVMCTEFE
jgi:hypothetical protein